MLVPDGGDFPQVPTVTDDIFTLWVEVHFLQDGLTKLQEYCSGLRASDSVPLIPSTLQRKNCETGWLDRLALSRAARRDYGRCCDGAILPDR